MASSQAKFEEIVREHQAMVFRTLLRLTSDREQVEDLAQECFLRLYRGLESFRGEAKVSTYLYRIVVNVAQDAWKQRRKERAAIWAPFAAEDENAGNLIENFAHTGPDAESHLMEQELWQAVDAALLELPPAERAVLVLYHQEECSYVAIADALGMPIGTVRTNLHRGRQRLGEVVGAKMKRREVTA